MLVTERLYLTADKKEIVKHGDNRAAYLFAAIGQEIPDKIAKQYGLDKPEQKQSEQPENKIAAEPENK